MKKILLLLVFVQAVFLCYGQKITIKDTVARGYYMPLDSGIVSYKIEIITANGIIIEKTITGNQLSAATISQIVQLPVGSRVFYEEITVFTGGKFYKRPSYGYYIGNKSTTVKAVQPPKWIMEPDGQQ